MKKVYTFFFAVILTAICLAQSPQKMSYQAVIRDGDDKLVQSLPVGMQISILQGSAEGTPIYIETQTPTTNVNGLVSIEIGGGNIVLGTFPGINWTTGPYFIKTETDPAGGTSYTITGTSQLLSVPYALHSKSAETSTDAVKLTSNQTISGNKTFTGTTTVPTPVNSTDATTKAYVDALKETIYNELLDAGLNGIVKDVDGNSYKAIKIGSQVWMAENLKTTKYNDGTAIPLVTNNIIWYDLTTPGYCWYINDEATYKTTYGALYNWYVVNTGNLCPTGWHMATDPEWTTLTTYLGGEAVAGGKLKETGTTHWRSPNTGATNETGFTALPGGFRVCNAEFFSDGDFGYLWSATEVDTYSAWLRDLNNTSSEAHRTTYCKRGGLSVRCIKD